MEWAFGVVAAAAIGYLTQRGVARLIAWLKQNYVKTTKAPRKKRAKKKPEATTTIIEITKKTTVTHAPHKGPATEPPRSQRNKEQNKESQRSTKGRKTKS